MRYINLFGKIKMVNVFTSQHYDIDVCMRWRKHKSLI